MTDAEHLAHMRAMLDKEIVKARGAENDLVRGSGRRWLWNVASVLS
jgi:hypothetical protein